MEELNEADRKAEKINGQAELRSAGREHQMDEGAKTIWEKHQKDRDAEIQNLNRHRFILLAPKAGHTHRRRR